MRVRLFIVVLALGVSFGGREVVGQAAVGQRLEQLLHAGPIPVSGRRAFPAHIGMLVSDAETGAVLFEHRSDESFTPASNMKLLSSAGVLKTFGPNYRFETGAFAASLSADGQTPKLTLRGSGDPTLLERGDGNTLESLARAVATRVRTVGELVVDDSLYAWPRWGNGWMWDDSESPISALFLAGSGSPYIALVKSASAIAAGERPNPGLLTDPDALPLEIGARWKRLLEQFGVRVGEVHRGRAGASDELVSSVRSKPLAEIIWETNKWSVNINAELLYAHLGIKDGVSTPDSSRAALETSLKSMGIDTEALRLRDASGLSRYNLLSPRAVATLLRAMYEHPIGAEGLGPREAFDQKRNAFINALPVGGTGEATPTARDEGGTLRNRFVGLGLDVRAKTGTMTGVSALSGYVRSVQGRVLAFSILCDNYAGVTSDLTRLQDALVQEMAKLF